MRKLASVKKIDYFKSIPNADMIEIAVIGGWEVVVKKGEFVTGELVIYCEIDSFIPYEVAPFLNNGKPKEYEGVLGSRLRTVKLRGALSQGLVLPLALVGDAEEGDDVSERLGIIKYDIEMPVKTRGLARGNFPSEVPKTDQERIQNLSKEYQVIQLYGTWQVTEKLHGTSCTFYLGSDDVFHVCSRNLDLKLDDENLYTEMAIKLGIESKLRDAKLQGLAIQGEIIGEGVNGNQYGLKGREFYVFDAYDTLNSSYLSPDETMKLAENLDLKHVPVIDQYFSFIENDEDEVMDNTEFISYVLNMANFKSFLNGSTAEGLVFKSYGKMSFKVINNEWLLNNKG